MTTDETTVRVALRQWADEAVIPPDLADRALAGRRRRHGMTAALAGTAAAVAGVVVLVAQLGYVVPGPSAPPAGSIPTAVPTAVPTDVRADPKNSPPRTLVAAGRTAMSAYYTEREESGVLRRTWHLYDPDSGGYREVPWAYLDVAPGLRIAAVLEGDLPAGRVGLFDMKTWKVIRWIPLDNPAGGLAFSPDGTRLLVTTYGENPDRLRPTPVSRSRTGFYVIDMETGRPGPFRPLPQCEQEGGQQNPNMRGCLDGNVREDFGWSRDGSLIYEQTTTVPTKQFYDLRGNQRPSPPHEDRYYESEAGLSPNGRYIAAFPKDLRLGPGVQKEDLPEPLRSVPQKYLEHGPLTAVTNVETGELVGAQLVLQLVAWADNSHLIAWDCGPGCKNEFRNRLVLVSVDGKEVKPLSGFRGADVMAEDRWTAHFTPRVP